MQPCGCCEVLWGTGAPTRPAPLSEASHLDLIRGREKGRDLVVLIWGAGGGQAHLAQASRRGGEGREEMGIRGGHSLWQCRGVGTPER